MITMTVIFLFLLALSLYWLMVDQWNLSGIFLGISISWLIAGCIKINNNTQKEKYTYTINYNNTSYYTNDYILSNGGIDFITENGHYVLPIEKKTLRIERNK